MPEFQIDGVTGIAVILIGSFAIDRIVTGTLFLLSFVRPWAQRFPDPATVDDRVARVKAEKKQQLAYFVLAGTLAIPILAGYGGVQLFSQLGFQDVHWLLDTVFTGLILVGGADRVSLFLRGSAEAGGGSSAPRPVEINGRLVLEGGSIQGTSEGSIPKERAAHG